MGGETQPRVSRGLVAVISALVLLTIWLGQIRAFQVDEVQWVFQSRILAFHGWGQASTSAPLWLLGPLAWWARRCQDAAAIFQGDRLLFTALLWLNLVLLVKAAGFRLRSQAGLLALIAAATLEPLWDYGFEIRHDNLLLTGLLAAWIFLVPKGRAHRGAYAATGALAALLQFCAFKAFLYWVPISALALLFPHPAHERGRLRLSAQWAAGFAGASAAALLCHLAAGTTGLLWADTLASVHASVQVERFSPWVAFGRLFAQTPLLLGAVVAAAIRTIFLWKKGEVRAAPWASGMPEVALLSIATLVLLANPTPFPYNLVLWVPFAFLAALQLREPLAAALASVPGAKQWALYGLLAAHVAPWIALTPRHWDHSNDRQLQVIAAAEHLTGPDDAVFDGAGLVADRPPFAFHWLLHTLTMPHFLDGSYPSVRASLAARCTPVILPSYRTSWLPDEDKTFITVHYVPLAPDLWVLGGRTPPGGGAWDCLHGGRYFLSVSSGGASLDGKPVQEGPLTIGPGRHQLNSQPGAAVQIEWLGPSLASPPRLGESEGPLFENWY